MRTVSFSTPRIQQAIAENFVALNTNTTADPTAGESFSHAPDDPPGSCIRGNGRQNVQTLFLTPDLEIMHVASGYLDPDDLDEEMDFALRVYRAIRSRPETDRETVISMHRQRLADAGFSEREINATSEMELMQSMISQMSDPGRGTGDSPRDMNAAFAPFIRREFLKDQHYSMRHPLESLSRFESDPGELVGRGTSFFGSSSSGSNTPFRQ